MKKIIVLIIGSLFIFSSCKSKKNANTTKATKMLVKEVVKNYENNKFDKKTVSASIKAKYKGKENLPSVAVSLRIKKDKIIWMSISKFISIGKLKITPDKVQFYNKLTKEYFDGDFSLISDFLGADITFEQIQNILVGDTIYDLDTKKYQIEPKDLFYEVKPKKQLEFFAVLFLLYASNFKTAKQEIIQDNKFLEISYPSYENIEHQPFPKEILIKAQDGNNKNSVGILYKSVAFNKNLSFPFKIPKGYKEIKL
ncbi:MAG TPA: DUF4292 domain-containing protein [Flavobacteriia bacterium]|nr:DUF4292 domain-containing protein [Flavobacteriia bacterium]